MQEPNAVVLRSGDKVLLCLSEEPSVEHEELLRSQLSGYFDAVSVAVVGGIRAVVVQPAGEEQ